MSYLVFPVQAVVGLVTSNFSNRMKGVNASCLCLLIVGGKSVAHPA